MLGESHSPKPVIQWGLIKVQIKITENGAYSLLEILADNGMPANAQNPIDEAAELPLVKFPEASGQLLIISGMPASAQGACLYKYKGTFGAIALANPKLGVALVQGSVNPNYKLGQSIPLE